MIIDTIRNSNLYENLGPNFVASFNYLRYLPTEMPPGVHWLNDSVKVIVSEYDTKPREDTKWEAHRNVIDIQFCASGVETTEWMPKIGLAPITDYNPEKDVEYYDKTITGIALKVGNGVFAVFFPDDVHRPCQIADGQRGKIKKVTIKISI